MYKSVKPKSAFEINDLLLSMYSIKPNNSESSLQLNNWFILASMPGLNVEYSFRKQLDNNSRYYTLTFNFMHNYFKLQDDILVKSKLFILYNYYHRYNFIGAYKMITEKTVKETRLEVHTSIDFKNHDFVEDLISNIKKNVLNIDNIYSEKEYSVSQRNRQIKNSSFNIDDKFKVDCRVYFHIYLTNSKEEDLAHLIVEIDSVLI
jgi:hypothetical protein